MIFRLVVGLSVVCTGFATSGVRTESKLPIQETKVGDIALALLCWGVAGEGTDMDSSAMVTSAVGETVTVVSDKLTSEDGFGDSGFEGCAPSKNNRHKKSKVDNIVAQRIKRYNHTGQNSLDSTSYCSFQSLFSLTRFMLLLSLSLYCFTTNLKTIFTLSKLR